MQEWRWRDGDGEMAMKGQRWRDSDGRMEIEGQKWTNRDGGMEMEESESEGQRQMGIDEGWRWK